MQKEKLIDLEDACVVERTADGKVHIKQAVDLAAIGAAQGGSLGALWGTLVELLLLNPLAGMALGALAGAGTGALSGAMTTDFGINDEFIEKLGETVPAGSSALFIQVKEMTEERVFRDRTLQAARAQDVHVERQRREAEDGAEAGGVTLGKTEKDTAAGDSPGLHVIGKPGQAPSARHLVEFLQRRIEGIPSVTTHAVRHQLRLEPARIVEARGMDN